MNAERQAQLKKRAATLVERLLKEGEQRGVYGTLSVSVVFEAGVIQTVKEGADLSYKQ